MEIWPAIDLRGGKCVRLQQGDYARETVFSDDPSSRAREFVAAGARQLHLVDLDGARDGKLTNRAAISAIVAAAKVPCQLGGGVRDEATIRDLLALGLSRLVVGTKALRDPTWFQAMCHKFPHQLALGIDARDGRVATDGWLATSDVAALDMARQFEEVPIAAIIYTDIARDGMLAGPNLAAMEEMRRAVSIPVIASGGVSGPSDVEQLARQRLAGVIIGRALYDGKITIPEALAAAERGGHP